jgi:hypothetical protein
MGIVGWAKLRVPNIEPWTIGVLGNLVGIYFFRHAHSDKVWKIWLMEALKTEGGLLSYLFEPKSIFLVIVILDIYYRESILPFFGWIPADYLRG